MACREGLQIAPQEQTPASKVSPPLSPAAASMAESPRRGAEPYDFVSAVPENLCCTGCGRVPKEPQVTQCCDRIYCPTCITAQGVATGGVEGGRVSDRRGVEREALAAGQAGICRNCEKEFSYKLDRTRQQKFYSLEVKCKNRARGCRWTGTTNAFLEHHSKTCVNALIPCPDCARDVERKNLTDHRNDDCRFRNTRCSRCNKEGTYAEIMGLDSTGVKHKCPMILVTCPNKCQRSKTYQRGKLAVHLTECPLQRVDCAFKAVGCEEQPVRKFLDLHMKNTQQQHLLLLLNAMQSKMVALEGEVDLLLKSVHDPATLSSLACMKSHMRMGKLCLDGTGDEITFRVGHFSHLESYSSEEDENREDAVWRAPPFYFLSSYRMELAVYPGGCGEQVGKALTLSLHIHKPENLGSSSCVGGWPLDCVYVALQISILQQLEKNQPQSDPHSVHKFKTITAHVCHICRQRHQLQVNSEAGGQPDAVKLVSEHKEFVKSHVLTEAGLCLHDSIVLRVELTPCECT